MFTVNLKYRLIMNHYLQLHKRITIIAPLLDGQEIYRC